MLLQTLLQGPRDSIQVEVNSILSRQRHSRNQKLHTFHISKLKKQLAELGTEIRSFLFVSVWSKIFFRAILKLNERRFCPVRHLIRSAKCWSTRIHSKRMGLGTKMTIRVIKIDLCVGKNLHCDFYIRVRDSRPQANNILLRPSSERFKFHY